MIICRRWVTNKTIYTKHGSNKHVSRIWEGYFLFGFLPIYLNNKSTQYS